MKIEKNTSASWKERLFEVIFESDTSSGKLFDVILIAAILISVIVVMLESVVAYRQNYGNLFRSLEWFFTILFTIEYACRILSVKKARPYIFSFFGIVDFLAIVPTYLSELIPGAQFLIVIRILRVLRVFRVLKLMPYISQGNLLLRALKASRYKISLFIFVVLTLVTIIGALMYLIEGEQNGFTSIPRGIYWAIVTLTTVGYGDISPQTSFGQTMAAIVMILGYGIIAVPTGIVTVELAQAQQKILISPTCKHCKRSGHDDDAKFCKHCGELL